MQFAHSRRREFISLFGSMAPAWSLAALLPDLDRGQRHAHGFSSKGREIAAGHRGWDDAKVVQVHEGLEASGKLAADLTPPPGGER